MNYVWNCRSCEKARWDEEQKWTEKEEGKTILVNIEEDREGEAKGK